VVGLAGDGKMGSSFVMNILDSVIFASAVCLRFLVSTSYSSLHKHVLPICKLLLKSSVVVCSLHCKTDVVNSYWGPRSDRLIFENSRKSHGATSHEQKVRGSISTPLPVQNKIRCKIKDSSKNITALQYLHAANDLQMKWHFHWKE
jgi:hypothetical protein